MIPSPPLVLSSGTNFKYIFPARVPLLQAVTRLFSAVPYTDWMSGGSDALLKFWAKARLALA